MINKRYTPVSGNSSFARDKITGAIVNINTNEFDQGEKRRQLAREEKQKMISLQNKVDHLDEEISEIKDLLYKVIGKIDGNSNI